MPSIIDNDGDNDGQNEEDDELEPPTDGNDEEIHFSIIVFPPGVLG